MEEELDNYHDARLIFERCLNRFPASDDKMALWRNYELMEQRAGNTDAALQVYQRSMRESIGVIDQNLDEMSVPLSPVQEAEPSLKEVLQQSKEVEVVRWGGDSTSMRRDVWMNNGSIEGKMPMKKRKNKRNKSENR
jgi:tetratricopeptide (TPR) repeat protein